MKKIYVLVTLLICLTSYAQEFVLTSEGFRDKANLENDYNVTEVPNKTQHRLFIESK